MPSFLDEAVVELVRSLGAAARRALAQRLPEWIAAAVWAFCDGPLRDEVYRVGKPLRRPFVGQYSARRGACRVRYRADAYHPCRV